MYVIIHTPIVFRTPSTHTPGHVPVSIPPSCKTTKSIDDSKNGVRARVERDDFFPRRDPKVTDIENGGAFQFSNTTIVITNVFAGRTVRIKNGKTKYSPSVRRQSNSYRCK